MVLRCAPSCTSIFGSSKGALRCGFAKKNYVFHISRCTVSRVNTYILRPLSKIYRLVNHTGLSDHHNHHRETNRALSTAHAHNTRRSTLMWRFLGTGPKICICPPKSTNTKERTLRRSTVMSHVIIKIDIRARDPGRRVRNVGPRSARAPRVLCTRGGRPSGRAYIICISQKFNINAVSSRRFFVRIWHSTQVSGTWSQSDHWAGVARYDHPLRLRRRALSTVA